MCIQYVGTRIMESGRMTDRILPVWDSGIARKEAGNGWPSLKRKKDADVGYESFAREYSPCLLRRHTRCSDPEHDPVRHYAYR